MLVVGGWRWGATPPAGLLAAASGTAFTVVVFGQLTNAFACRSESRAVGRWSLRGNPLLLGAGQKAVLARKRRDRKPSGNGTDDPARIPTAGPRLDR